LPEELLKDVAEVGRLAKRSKSLSDRERTHIQIFSRVLNDTWPSGDYPAFLSAEWCAIRDAAKACLESLGGDLTAWEIKELRD